MREAKRKYLKPTRIRFRGIDPEINVVQGVPIPHMALDDDSFSH